MRSPLAVRRSRLLRLQVEARAAAADAPARFKAPERRLARLVEAHRDLQPPQRPIERLQREAQVGQVGRARAHDELAALPGEQRAGLEQRPQRWKHLLCRAMTERNDFQGVFRAEGHPQRK